VLATWNTWIGGIVTKYSIDGLRLDSALEVDVDFFSPFEAAGKSAVIDNKMMTYTDHSQLVSILWGKPSMGTLLLFAHYRTP